jgi:two-component system sensor histidine kinase VicK
MPSSDPSTWFGEHSLTSPGDGREIREFFGPVLKKGELAGFVRVGFYANPETLAFGGDTSYFALLALPVFLFTSLSYFMIRREIQPLSRLSAKLDEVGKSYGAIETGLRPGGDLRDFIQRFDHLLQLVQARVRETDEQRLAEQTANRLLAYKQEKVSAVLDSLPEAVLVIDDSSVPSYANSKLESLLGVSLQQVIGEAPQKWCKHKEALELLARLKSQGHAVINTISTEYSPEGQPDRRISVVAYPMFSPRADTTLLGRLIVFREISDEYRARRAGAEFVAQVSHELKGPLSNIAGYSELLLDYATLEERERVNSVNVIHDEVLRATALIANLLNISKLESGTLPIARQRVKMADLLRDARAGMSRNAQVRGVSLELEIPPDLGTARLDKELFRIAIDNLMSNAVKYSNPGGNVIVRAENLDDMQMKISVRDQGIGISPEDCKKVFDKYYRSSDKAVTARSGHGLGLYLARQIVELHHGTISVESELGKGTQFTVQFPIQTQQLTDSAAT